MYGVLYKSFDKLARPRFEKGRQTRADGPRRTLDRWAQPHQSVLSLEDHAPVGGEGGVLSGNQTRRARAAECFLFLSPFGCRHSFAPVPSSGPRPVPLLLAPVLINMSDSYGVGAAEKLMLKRPGLRLPRAPKPGPLPAASALGPQALDNKASPSALLRGPTEPPF